MKRFLWQAVAGLAAIATTLGVGALSQVPYTAEPGQHAVLRLAWRARGTRVEECRRRSAEELAQLPVHMRREEICEGRMLAYRLVVTVDDTPMADEAVRPAGARADRPLYVFRELPLTPGSRAVRVTFRPERRPGEPYPVGGGGTPPLEFARRLSLRAGEVALVTYDEEHQELILKGYGALPPR